SSTIWRLSLKAVQVAIPARSSWTTAPATTLQCPRFLWFWKRPCPLKQPAQLAQQLPSRLKKKPLKRPTYRKPPLRKPQQRRPLPRKRSKNSPALSSFEGPCIQPAWLVHGSFSMQVESQPMTASADLVRLRFDIAYDGTDFHGWASQKGQLRTVQGVLEQCLTMILRHPIELTVAGRTDAGVHAAGQVAHADVPVESLQQRSIDGDPAKLVRRLAMLVDDDIRIHNVSFAPEGFDARFSALRRHYVYRITTEEAGALPTRLRDTATWTRPVDIELMQQAATTLVGLHDFAAFSKAKPHATTIRDLQEFYWVDASTPSEPNLYEAHVSADAFCWSMVRSLVG